MARIKLQLDAEGNHVWLVPLTVSGRKRKVQSEATLPVNEHEYNRAELRKTLSDSLNFIFEGEDTPSKRGVGE